MSLPFNSVKVKEVISYFEKILQPFQVFCLLNTSNSSGNPIVCQDRQNCPNCQPNSASWKGSQMYTVCQNKQHSRPVFLKIPKQRNTCIQTQFVKKDSTADPPSLRFQSKQTNVSEHSLSKKTSSPASWRFQGKQMIGSEAKRILNRLLGHFLIICVCIQEYS